jgi:hypothetical protein
MYGPPQPEMAVGEFVTKMKEDLREAYKQVQQTTQQNHRRKKFYYDKKVAGKPFKNGDYVWLFSEVVPRGQNKKLHHPWSGPYRIVKKLSEVN